MPIRFACPACRTPYTVPDPDAGKKTECPVCRQRVQIPVPDRLRTVVGVEAPALVPPRPPTPVLIPDPPAPAPSSPAPAPRATSPPPPPPLAPLPGPSGPAPGQMTGPGLAVLAASLAVVLVGLLVLVIVVAGRTGREEEAAVAHRDPAKGERPAVGPARRAEPGPAKPPPTGGPPPGRMKGVGPGDPRLPAVPPVPPNVTGKVMTGDQLYLRLVHSAVLLQTRSVARTGFVVSAEHRLVVTNRHVVGSDRRAQALFPTYDRDGKLVTDLTDYDPAAVVPGDVVATDEACDLALVRVERLPPDSGPVVFAKAPAGPGDTVYSVGRSGVARNLAWRLTKGTVRGRVRRAVRIETGRIDCMILETDAPINRGDSGGPVLKDRGELVAAVSHHATDQQQVSGGIDAEEVQKFVARYVGR